MRVLTILMFSFLLLNLASCKTKQNGSQEKTLLKMDSIKNTAKKMYLFKNKKLELSESYGSLVYKMVDNEKTNVIQFLYEKDMDKVAYDGGYKEEIVFEFPNSVSEQNYKDVELQNTKMLFGRYCFCRGKTGLYYVKEGQLHLKVSKKETHFELQFTINEVPQVINEISY